MGSGDGYKIWPTPSWPENIVELDGTTISDTESPINGLKLPNLNDAGPYADSTVAGGMHLRGGTTAGVLQEDQLQGHEFAIEEGQAGGALQGAAGASRITNSGVALTGMSTTIVTDGAHGDPRTGKETRPRSMSVVYIMRIK